MLLEKERAVEDFDCGQFLMADEGEDEDTKAPKAL